ncbi:MAG: hypothetical protein ACREFO_21405 [Acetobacteraceae bacterium]
MPGSRIVAACLRAPALAWPIAARAQMPADWFTMNKDYSSRRYVALDQITPENVGPMKEIFGVRLASPATWPASRTCVPAPRIGAKANR